MPTYAYEAMNASGQEVREEVDAASSEEAIAKIRGKGYFPTKVREKAGKKKVQKKAQKKPVATNNQNNNANGRSGGPIRTRTTGKKITQQKASPYAV